MTAVAWILIVTSALGGGNVSSSPFVYETQKQCVDTKKRMDQRNVNIVATECFKIEVPVK